MSKCLDQTNLHKSYIFIVACPGNLLSEWTVSRRNWRHDSEAREAHEAASVRLGGCAAPPATRRLLLPTRSSIYLGRRVTRQVSDTARTVGGRYDAHSTIYMPLKISRLPLSFVAT